MPIFFTNLIGIPSTIVMILIPNGEYSSVRVYAQISVLSLFCKEMLSQLLKWNDLLAENYTGT